MGGNSSTHGGIAFSFENSTCIAGEIITGVLNVSVTKSSGPGTLYLRFKGIEKTNWVTRTKRGKDYHNTYHTGRHKICNVSYPIYNFDHGLAEGGYSLPFSFRLPEHIPSTFSYQPGSSLFETGPTSAVIKYKFFGKFVGLSNELIKGKQEVTVRHLSYSFEKSVEQKVKANFKTWCCVQKGSCELSVSYPQDSYNPSQNAKFYAIVDNSQSKLSIVQVVCRFGYTMRLRDNQNRTHLVKKNLIEKRLSLTMKAGQQEKSQQVEFDIDFREVQETLRHMFTTKNNLIECIYTNDIEAETDGCCMCCGDYAKIVSPINIIPNILAEHVAPQIPQGWAPQMLNSVELHYDMRNDVPLTDRPEVSSIF